MKEIINIIKTDKRAKILTISGILIIFTFTLGLSLSVFNNTYSNQATNITVNGLSFNITTNNQTSDDRILKLKAGEAERFTVVLTNKNNMNVKYELIYEYCGEDQNCINPSTIPNNITIGLDPVKQDEVSGEIETTKTINLLTNNQTTTDKYIRLTLNAGYSWNDLALVNQIGDYYKDINFIAYVDGIEQEDFPNSCNYTYTYETYKNGVQTTDSEVTLTCSNNKWNIYVTNIPSQVKIYFTESQGTNITEYIASLDKTSNSLEEDTTTDKNLRYVGTSPNNYISFNDETWRIIGVFNEGIKIIRQESIGNYAWNSANSNDWSNSSLQTYLNGDYYNSLTPTAQTQIANETWNLGGWSSSSISAADMYTYERGTKVYSGRPTTWQGYIALMYPSDYGYASNTTACTSNLSYCDNTTAKANNWLYSGSVEWLLSPDSSGADRAFYVHSAGYVYPYDAVNILWAVRPTLYLKSTTLITGGDGTSSNPYTIE